MHTRRIYVSVGNIFILAAECARKCFEYQISVFELFHYIHIHLRRCVRSCVCALTLNDAFLLHRFRSVWNRMRAATLRGIHISSTINRRKNHATCAIYAIINHTAYAFYRQPIFQRTNIIFHRRLLSNFASVVWRCRLALYKFKSNTIFIPLFSPVFIIF